MTRRDKIILLNIMDSIDEIQGYCQKEGCASLNDFIENRMLKRAVAMCMISISETIIHFSVEFKDKHTDINIKQFKTIRNIAAHNYGAINFTKLWDAITIDIPKLQNQLEVIYETAED